MKKIISLIAFLCVSFAAFAQQNILPLLPATTVAGGATNNTAGNGFIGLNIDQVAVFQLTVISTNTAFGALSVYLETSDNGTDWIANSYTLATTSSGTTAATSITRITNSVGGKYVRVGRVGNPTTNAVEVLRFTVSPKEE
jgi:hypothetical protein